MSKTKTETGPRALRTGMILMIVVLAFVASYQIAVASNGTGKTVAGGTAATGSPIPASAGDTGGSPACACCGNGGTGETIEGASTVEGDVQRISVDATNGYNPNVIRLKAGVPAEISFSQGTGCMGQVMSEDLGFFEDLTDGAKTVRIEADKLQPGEYGFSCGMQMVFGTIIVE